MTAWTSCFDGNNYMVDIESCGEVVLSIGLVHFAPSTGEILYRAEDESGSSGTGWVAEGIQFTNELCALTWRSAPGGLKVGEWSSGAIYPHLDMIQRVHGHGGKTQIRFIDETDPPHDLGCTLIRYGLEIGCDCGLPA